MKAIAPILFGALLFACAAPALATGNVRIEQSDHSVQTYTNVVLRIVNKTLMLTSADKVSTVVISDAQCAHKGALIKCTGGRLSLQQDRKNHSIPFKTATFYFNLTDQDQPVPSSTMKLGAHSVVFMALTAKGTHITGNGKLDKEPAK